MNEKELSILIHEAITIWDYNPMTKIFANKLAKVIIRRQTIDEKLLKIE